MAQHAPTLSSAVIRGSSVYESADLFTTYREHLGKPIDAEQAGAIGVAIQERYVRDGYSRPQIRIDDDLVALGILRIDVLEARIGTININGNPGPHRPRLETLGEGLLTQEALRQADLQRILRQMRDLPGLTLAATTTAESSAPNVYTLDVETEFRPVSGVIRLTNRGTDEAGPNFALGQFMANGLFGGRTSLGGSFGAAIDYEEYRGFGLLIDRRFGENGLNGTATAFRSRSNPHEAPLDRDDRYLRDRLSIGIARPFALSPGATLSLTTALNFDDLEILRAGERLRDERLRMLSLAVNRGWRGSSSVQYSGLIEVVKGLDGLNSGLDAADLASDPRSVDFLLVHLTLSRLAQVSEQWSWRIDTFAQQTADVLPYTERFKIGGDRLGRGFEVPEIAGDVGLGAKVELRRRMRDLPALAGGITAYGFYDIAATEKHDVEGRESAATAGMGLRVQARRLSGWIEVAKPLTHGDVEGRRDLALFAEIAVRL